MAQKQPEVFTINDDDLEYISVRLHKDQLGKSFTIEEVCDQLARKKPQSNK